MKKSAPQLLEPVMKVEITVPEEYMGDVMGDVSSRRGRIEGMDLRMVEFSLLRLSFHLLKCSVTQLTFVQALRVVVLTQWKLTTTNQFLRVFRKRLLLVRQNNLDIINFASNC